MNGILWLASYPKSGNTWLRLFIENLFRNTVEPAPINEIRIVRYGDNMISLYEQAGRRPVTSLSDEEIHRLRKPVQHFLATRSETMLVKTHNALLIHGGIPTIYSEYTAGAVYLLRNPFDLAVSFAAHYRLSHDDAIDAISSPYNRTKTTKMAVFQILTSWTDHYRSWFTADGLTPLLLRYEDMVSNPVKSFGRFMRILGVPKNPERLRRAVRHSSFQEANRQEMQFGFRERSHAGQQFFRAGKIGTYREVLSDKQIGRLIDAHGELLLEQGYISKNGRLRV